MSLVQFLVAMVGPLAARLLLSCGLSLITLTGLTALYSSFKDQVVSGLGALPSAGVQLGGLFGLWEAIGITLGAISFCVTWQATKGFWAIGKSS